MGNDTGKINRTLIFGNGILHPKFLRDIRPGDYIIGVDRAAYWLLSQNITPDMAIGDFDSVRTEEFKLIKKSIRSVKQYPAAKDKTDMELALSYARGQTVLYGWSGTRLDHTFATLHMMSSHVLIDEHNRIRLIGPGKTVIEKASYRYISVIPNTKIIRLSLHGFRYNLDRKMLKQGTSRGISNEIVGKTGTIELFSGKAWVIESND